MLQTEGTGKNIEKAIEDALLKLHAPREDVDIKILEEGGLFKKSKVLVSISEDVKDKYAKNEPKITVEKCENNQNQQKIEAACTCFDEDCSCDECTCEHDCACDEECSCLCGEHSQMLEKEQNQNKVFEIASNFITQTLRLCQIDATVEKFENEEQIMLIISSNSQGDIIGKHGDVLNALQFLTMAIVDKNVSRKNNPKRIVLDCENYRMRREDSLILLADRLASKVLKTHRVVKLEPMPANERRIIHLALQDRDGVITYSKGTEPHRFLIIAPKGSKRED